MEIVMKTGLKIRHTLTYDPYNCTSAGVDIWLHSDGKLIVETESRWQGSRTGVRTRWQLPPEWLEQDRQQDGHAYLLELYDRARGELGEGKILSRGYIVR